ncbi:MAG TPA: hypothetical protein VHT91_47055 [Kofleriaceae bacterium]|jgi:hypothetical protein|nr:hypothetical protein [Kofleriaceae bacterium]
MQRKPVHHEELEPEYLDIVAGGRSKVLKQQFGPASHHFETLSDPIPGATLEEANALVNRFNAPTKAGLIGEGNDPHATEGTVMEPYTPLHLELGGITMTRGEGDDHHAWVKNTADALHPFIGTTTRTVVDSPEGYRILTVGDGHGDGAIPAGPIGTAIRHGANAALGPGVFQDLDDNMLNHWHKPEPAHDAQPHADRAREQPQSGANE